MPKSENLPNEPEPPNPAAPGTCPLCERLVPASHREAVALRARGYRALANMVRESLLPAGNALVDLSTPLNSEDGNGR